MNSAHLHLLVNHIPILGTLFGLLLLVLSRWKPAGRGAVVSALILLILAGVASEVAVLSGENAHELLEGVASVGEAELHEHEEMAETANVISIITGLAALAYLILLLRGNVVKTWVFIGMLALALVSSGTMLYTGLLGGHIRHPETTGQWTAPEGDHDHEEAEEAEAATAAPDTGHAHEDGSDDHTHN